MTEEKKLTPNPSEELVENTDAEETPAELETPAESETQEEVAVEEEQEKIKEVDDNATIEETEEAAEPETEDEPETEAIEAPVEAAEPIVEKPFKTNDDGVPYKTELISSGPLSEEIRVFELKDLNKIQKDVDEEQRKIYESSLRDISQEQRVIGTIVTVNENEILMDVGFKSEGVISRDEFEEGEGPKVGDQIEVFVDVLEDENGQMILSKKKADFMRVWERVRDIHDTAETIEGRITNRIKGGMVVDIMGIDAFLPGSQIDIRPVTDFDSYVGKTFEFRIVKLNELRKNIVLSRKEILEESMKEKRDDLLSKIKVGDVLKGRVKNITDFGVFIDLGGLDGLLHITDLSWGRVNHPKEVVGMDDELTVKVIDYDSDKQRVSLGLKQLTPHPWEGIEERYPIDSIVKGKVVNIANYGVFVELEKGVEGLIHISEISWTQHIKHPSEVFSLGEEIEAKVLNIDGEERKISLGFKQLEPDPWETIEQTYVPNSTYKGIVRNLTPYGVFVELQEGIDGFVHISDLSWTRKIRHPREIIKRGDEIDVRILEVSKENRKITLGVKQAETDPWPMIEGIYTEGSIVEGEVAKITEKVIVVNLEHDVDAIVPIGQMPKKDRNDVSKAISVGEKLQLKVLEVNKNEKRIVLSRDQAIPKEPKNDAEAYMLQQTNLSDKIEIPDEIRKKIAKSEKAKKVVETVVKEKAPKKASKKKITLETEEPAAEVEKETETKPAPKKRTKKRTKKAEPETEEDAGTEKKTVKKAAPKKTAAKKTSKKAKKPEEQDESDKPEEAK
ncbi:MAG: 30S ribosomal protein S1 [Candidatus Marinimicrobia bacterium]|nr:30S ribosomal protein S1 [Candidatus Neomarinimicrobiota bacterium]